MREYVLSVCFAVIFCVGVSVVIPHKKYEGILRILCGIFVISTVASPIPAVLKTGYQKFTWEENTEKEDFFGTIEESKKSYTRYMQENIRAIAAEEIKKEIKSVFGTDVNVTVDNSSDSLCIENANPGVKEDIKKYIAENYSVNTVFDD